MRWQRGRRSSNVDDRRGQSGGRMPGGFKLGGGGLILVVVAALLFGVNPLEILALLGGGGGPAPVTAPGAQAPQREATAFVEVVLASTEDVWSDLFADSNAHYPEPTLTLYDGAIQSACGYNTAATGPFYCPGDQEVYLDLSFLGQLQQLGAPGDFAFAYVIGHEVGHHIQTVTGTSQRVRQQQARAGQAEANALSVRMELQADCYAGLWAHHANRQWQAEHGVALLEPGDVEEGLRAAAAIGDDRLQQQAGGRVQPESFTHGTSEQRVEWLRRGLETGRVEACDTFEGSL